MAGLDWLTRRPIAHRGLHDLNGKCWENTLSAFDAAARAGFSIECDVHLSADGVPVVFHDEDLNRLCGRDGQIHLINAAEATALAIGGTADRVPTLREALALIAGRVPIIIELKGIAGRDDGLVAAVAAELDAYEGHAAIMSFDHHLVRRFPADAPGIPGGLTAEGVKTRDIEAHFAMLAHELAFISYNVHHLPNPFVAFVREKLKMPVITWTVRNQADKAQSNLFADQITFEGFNPDSMLA
ncbi:glycerophosphodiester phosphodiesterase [Phyllobacterium leguminum]|uniref:Glycerophosphoryl diester phosphodiesterase n=1 Tax=Phyllobacterium leguminum TaxID=314237 RepID=A0A318T1I5_9HYPH|nr:glycerophosphodiester phosphodiesterase [Phyllobacterium leguminum]PYE88176.1 glycerophosphoryl diester phosphodiesterase [Phyllobacterium leguminum]